MGSFAVGFMGGFVESSVLGFTSSLGGGFAR
jgi:hypothetical protein